MDASVDEVRRALRRRVRQCLRHNIVDQTGVQPREVAIYTLSDPREVQDVRYVGQSRSPQSRYAQHINAARLWLPDELPWWIKREELRPVYAWIRELYADEGRLPVMFVVGWTTRDLARSDERRFVRALVGENLALVNREADVLRERLATGRVRLPSNTRMTRIEYALRGVKSPRAADVARPCG